MNVAWTDIDSLEKPAKTFVFGPRFGRLLNSINHSKILLYGLELLECIQIVER